MSDPTLRGRTVLVTRPAEEAVRLVALLEERGAHALVAPTIRLMPAPAGPLDRALSDAAAGRFEWLVLTSRAGVEAVFDRLAAAGLEASDLPASVAAVGDGTAGALRDRGVEPALVPGTFTTEALGRAMPTGTGRVLLARADIAPDGLEGALSAKGWTPVRVDGYRTRPAGRLPAEARRALDDGRVDAVTFTSASTVEGFVRAAGQGALDRRAGGGRRPRVICIGPVTSRHARAAGWRVDAVARPHTVEGLVAAVERVLARRSS